MYDYSSGAIAAAAAADVTLLSQPAIAAGLYPVPVGKLQLTTFALQSGSSTAALPVYTPRAAHVYYPSCNPSGGIYQDFANFAFPIYTAPSVGPTTAATVRTTGTIDCSAPLQSPKTAVPVNALAYTNLHTVATAAAAAVAAAGGAPAVPAVPGARGTIGTIAAGTIGTSYFYSGSWVATGLGLDYCNIAGVPTCTWWGMGVQQRSVGTNLNPDPLVASVDSVGDVASGWTIATRFSYT